MSVDTWLKCLATAETAGPSLASFTTGSLLPSHAKHTIGPDQWWIGKKLKIKASVNIGNVVTAQPTFTFEVKFGSAVVWTSGAILTSTTVHTALPCEFEVDLTCRIVNGSGATAQMIGAGKIVGRPFLLTGAGAVADYAGGHPSLILPQTAPILGATFDSNAAQQVDLNLLCSASNASNTAALQQYELLATEL